MVMMAEAPVNSHEMFRVVQRPSATPISRLRDQFAPKIVIALAIERHRQIQLEARLQSRFQFFQHDRGNDRKIEMLRLRNRQP